MLITTDELAAFSGVYRTGDETFIALQTIYINSATAEINKYIGTDVTAVTFWNELSETDQSQIKMVCLEIASLIQMEESGNLGVNSQSFGEAGTRTFLNVVDFSKYLQKLAYLRTADALEM